jgi:hypothetical protein
VIIAFVSSGSSGVALVIIVVAGMALEKYITGLTFGALKG